MEGSITWVGIDAHKKTLVVAVLSPGCREPEEFSVENTEPAIRKLVSRLERSARGREIRICYEAGTCGFALQRRLEGAGKVVCEVIAPALIPRKPGERVKTDQRDARKLAEMHRAGLLTAVSPPTPEEEAVRDLCRCREVARLTVGRCRQQLVKMLVRRGYIFAETDRLWTQAHRRWLDGLVFDIEIDRFTVEQYKLALAQAERRLATLDAELERVALLPLYEKQVGWLRCFYGIDTIIALIFVAEVYAIDRFDSPRKLAAYLGVVPSLHASGESAKRGSITKTGNKHVRRVLLQAAWLYARSRNVGSAVRKRREGQPESVVSIAEAAKTRLTSRFQRLLARRKNPNKVVIAIMRELVGFLWAALRAGAATTIKTASRPAVGQRRKARKEKCAA